MKIRKALAQALVFSAVSLGVGSASADYICNVLLIPGNSTLGAEGYFYATFYTERNCTGSHVATRYFCTTGASATQCASSSNFRYDRPSLMSMHLAYQQAAIHDQFVQTIAVGCNGGALTCGGYTSFSARD